MALIDKSTNTGPLPSTISRTRFDFYGVEIEIEVDWRQVHSQARTALVNKSRRSKLGALAVKIVDPKPPVVVPTEAPTIAVIRGGYQCQKCGTIYATRRPADKHAAIWHALPGHTEAPA